MANIFLSYDRDDELRARPVAALLERNGHKVWWDRAIKGGHEFGAEIEAALNEAEKVVVLWSREAVKSAWVRDEAAVGRDTGRLVPATIDGTPPPLGFRQFQTIDLSKWKGRGGSQQIDAFLSAVESDADRSVEAAPALTKRPSWRPDRRLVVAGAVLIAIAMASVLAWQFWPTGAAATPTFAIVPADGSPASRQLATEIATRVSSIDDPSGADFHLLDAGAARGSGYSLKVSAGSAAGTGALSLVSGGSNAMMWSTPLNLGQGTRDDFAQAASITAQRALSCAAEALSYRREKISPETLKLYLSGCTTFDAAYGTNSSSASLAKLFERVIAKAPHFAPAWSKLFAVESENIFVLDPEGQAIVREARAQLERAKQLGIDVGEASAVEAQLISPADFLAIFRVLDDGVRKHPDSAFLYRWRGERYTSVGRMNEAVSDVGHAVQLDPLSPANQQSFASELAYSGNVAAGYAQLRNAERLWPNSTTVGMARYRMDLRFGDPAEAQRLYLKYALQLGDNPAQEKFIEARISPTPENISAALEATRKMNRQFPPFISDVIQALGQFGRKDEAIDLLVNYPGGKFIGYNAEVFFRPAMRDIWRDPRSMAGAAHVGLLHYWKASGRWPDFCFDPTLPYDCKKEAAKYRV